MKYGLLGEKLPHSHSPKIHGMLGNHDYTLFEKEKGEVADFLAARDFDGINVTIPYKQTVMPLCDVLDGAAIEIGAVNTVTNCDGKLFGCNTDFDGFIFMCNRAGIDMKGKKVLILGGGGTSHTATAAAKKLGAASVRIADLDRELNYTNLYDEASDAEIIIHTTPVGMYPKNEGKLVDLKKFPSLSGVVDVVYNPLRTRLICEAQSLGIPCTGGLTMLVAQAAFADKYFRGARHSGAEIVDIVNRVQSELENIVLIGMPGCGKSTAGKYVAKQLGREFVDIDKVIVERAGKSIPDIFAEHGEEYFRDLETEVAMDVSKRSGIVIACGGGTVLREENRTALHQNGKVVYIKRNLESLAKGGRPLSQGENALEKLYEVRRPIYEGFADVIVEPCGAVEDCVKAILKQTGVKR
ncbi:MAG: AAA family ATPase [Clostridia bacterium]|nr:AAA family ATPase [Clostridia bacterium]